MFELDKARYMTKGIAREVPLELQIAIWAIIQAESGQHQMDYLQVFQLHIDEQGNLHIEYKQEVPEKAKTYELPNIGRVPSQLDGRKIYVIDDMTHITMLFASEY